MKFVPFFQTSSPSSPSLVEKSGYNFSRVFWQGKIGPAFWTISSVLSLSLNLILIAVLILAGKQLFTLKSLVSDQLVNGLHRNFVLMDKAHIITEIQVVDTIQVVDEIPVIFDLPLHQQTEVVLVQDTMIPNAIVYLNGMAVPAPILLRQGTPLNISLELTVPVSQMVPVVLNVPVNLTVPVDIPLNQTELHEPFVGLQDVIAPYQQLLSGLPAAWDDTPACLSGTDWLCRWLSK
jgi:hypothetical protein